MHKNKSIAAFLILSALPCCSLIVRANELPVEAFGSLPAIRNATLSPDGTRIAFLQDADGQTVLRVYRLDADKSFLLGRADNEKTIIGAYTWANDDIMLISMRYPSRRYGTATTESHLLRIRVEPGAKPETILKPRRRSGGTAGDHFSQFQDNIVSPLPDEPNHILMAFDVDKPNYPSVYKVDVSNGRRERVQRNRSKIVDWMADRQGRVRLAYGRDETKIFYRVFDLRAGEWRDAWDYELFDTPAIRPMGFGIDPNHLYIRALHEGRYAVFRVHLDDPEFTRELVHADPNYDVDGGLIYSPVSNDVVGVSHGEADDSRVYWDPGYLGLQEGFRRVLPDSANIIASMSRNERRYILYSFSSNKPGSYYFGDRDEVSLEYLFTKYPLLENVELPPKQKIVYQASRRTRHRSLPDRTNVL
ncbi:MAG: hypothetical protein QF790_06400 [Gammaproteobacteria bacterium]|nr:hypothetical protein [Gammaproteobacteria bacterium]MDP6616777.1 hypothetical protein [Gammaproteobacteria bacterium]MDP6695959.1 hypothetical protein [Gammaproteobacteria bacterium]